VLTVSSFVIAMSTTLAWLFTDPDDWFTIATPANPSN
jgi:hypothetical protein